MAIVVRCSQQPAVQTIQTIKIARGAREPNTF